MGDLNGQAVLEELSSVPYAARGFILDNRKLTIVMQLLEQYTRRNHGHICDQERHLRDLEKETREVREAERTLAGRWDRVWDDVRFAFIFSRVSLRRELRKEQDLTRLLARIALNSVNILFDNLGDTRRRLCALEAAAGLPVGARPIEPAAPADSAS